MDARLIVAIDNYEEKSEKLYKKSLEVFKQEMASVDPADEIYFDSNKTPIIIEILDGFSFSASDANIAEYIAKYNRAKNLQTKLEETEARFIIIFDELNKRSQPKSAQPQHKSKVSDDRALSIDIEVIEATCLEFSSAKEVGIFVNSKKFLKRLTCLKQKLSGLNDQGLLSLAKSPVEIFESTTFDDALSLDNLVKYSKSKNDSFKVRVKEMFEKPEKKLDSTANKKFLHKFEIAILQAKASGEISDSDSKSLFRIKDKVQTSFLKAYLENTSDGILTAIYDKFSAIDDRTTILTIRTYATSVTAAGAGKAASHMAEEDDRAISDFE